MLGTTYLFVMVPAIALIGGVLAVRGSEQDAARIREADAQRRQTAG